MHARYRNAISRSFVSGSLTVARGVAFLLAKLSTRWKFTNHNEETI